MLKYEYLVVSRPHKSRNDIDDLYRVLNGYADDGWWVVSIHQDQNGADRIVLERLRDKSNIAINSTGALH